MGKAAKKRVKVIRHGDPWYRKDGQQNLGANNIPVVLWRRAKLYCGYDPKNRGYRPDFTLSDLIAVALEDYLDEQEST